MASGYTLPTSKNIWELDPTSIPGCTLWLDGADTSTLFSDYAGTTLATPGGNILRWTDKATLRLPAITNNIATTSYNGIYGVNPPTLTTDSLTGKPAVGFGVGSVIATAANGTTNTITCTSSITLQQRQPVIFTQAFGNIIGSNIGVVYYVYNPVGTPTTSFQITADPNTTTLVSTGTTSAQTCVAVIGSASMLLPYGSFSATTTTSSANIAINISAPTNSVTLVVGQPLYLNTNFGGLSANTVYYVRSVNGTTPTTSFTVSLVPGGTTFTASSTVTGTIFIGSDTTTNSLLGYPATFAPGKNETTMFVVAKYGGPVTTAPYGIFGYGSNSAGAGRFISFTSSTTAEVNNNSSGGGFAAALSIPSLSSNSANIISTIQSNTNICGWRNGTTITPFDLATNYLGNWTMGITVATIGGRFNYMMYGQIMEILHFSTALGASDRQAVEGYLAWKWGLQSSLPEGHPYAGFTSLNSFVPTSVGGTALWLDASDSSSVTLSGSNVTQWTDKSGNNNHATPLVSAPTYNTSIQNSLGGIVFNGSNDLRCPAFLTSPNHSVFCVLQYTSLTAETLSLGVWRRLAGSFVAMIGTASNTIGIRCGVENTGTYNVSASYFIPMSVGQTYMQGMTLSSSTSSNSPFAFVGSINGTSSNTNGTSSLGNINACQNQFGIGCIIESGAPKYNFTGFINEVIVYSNTLTTNQRQQIEGYLAWKWGLQSSLPRSHPFYAYTPSKTLRPFSRNFVPTDIDNCQVWLDPADSTTVTAQPIISQWNDKSGNNRHCTVTGTPRYTSSGLNTSAGYFNTPPFVISSTSTVSVFVVMNIAVPHPSLLSYIFSSNTYSNITLARNVLSGNYAYVGYLNTASINVASTYTTLGQTVIYELIYTPNTTTLYVSGGFSASSTATPGTALTTSQPFVIGGTQTYFYTGTIYEVLCYDTALSTSNRNIVEGYLAWKWGIQSTLVAGHPYISAAPVGFTPTSISGCGLWLDAADSSSVILSPIVTNWREKTTNTSPSVTGLPRYISGTYPAIRFTGISEFLNYGTSLLNIGTQPFTIFALAKQNSQQGSAAVFPIIGRNINTAPIWWMGYNSLNMQSQNIVGSTNLNLYVTTSTSTTYAPHIFATDYIRNVDGTTTGIIYQNGQSQTSGSATLGSSAGAFPLFIGAGNNTLWNLNADVNEIIVYVGSGTTSPLTLSQRQMVEGYLAWKWGTQSSLSPTHPYYSAAPVGFVPTSITGCGFWVDASDATTIQTSSLSAVVSVADKSGQGNTFSNPGSGLLYGNTMNTIPTLSGTNGNTSNTLLSPTISRDGYNHSYFAVYQYPIITTAVTAPILTSTAASNSIFRILISGTSVFLQDIFTGSVGSNSFGGQIQLNTTGAASTAAFLSNNTFLVTGIRQNTFFTMICNGSAVRSAGNNGAYQTGIQNTPTIQFTLGMPSVGGQFGEIILYNSALTVAQRQMVEGYLMWKWGLRTGGVPVPINYSMPRDHPYYNYPPPALTDISPAINTYKTTFDPADLLPAVWLDPADSSTITTDTNGRIMTILNKGTITQRFITITQITNNVDLTVNSTTYLTIGTLIMIYNPIAGTPGTTGSTGYYVSSVSGSVIRIATSVANAFAGVHINTLTNTATPSNGFSAFMTFARPTAGTGTGILGPLLTDSRILTPSTPATERNVPYMDFSTGGNYAITAGTLGSDLRTMTFTVYPAHNGDIPVGKMVFLNMTAGAYANATSATINTGPFPIVAAYLQSSTQLIVTTNTSGQFSLNGSITLTLNEATYFGGADATGLTGDYTIPASNTSITATSATTTNITLISTAGFGIGSAISFTTNYAGLTANTNYYVFSISGNDVGLSTLPMGIGFARRALTATASGATGTAGTGGFACTLTIPSNANNLGLLAVSDGHVRINSGTVGYYLTQAGTTGSTVVLTAYAARGSAGAITTPCGYISYGTMPITSGAVTATNTLTIRTVAPHGLSAGDVCAINFIASGMCSPFLITIRTSGTTLTEMATQFTTATISGTTLTITLATNPFYIGNPPTNYVGLSSFRVVLPYGTTYSNGTDASGILVASGGVSQAGSNSTTLVLIITAASPVDGSLIFGGLPGMIDTGVFPLSSTSSFNSTQTLSAGTTGNTLVIPFGFIGTPVSQLNGKFLFMNSSGQLALPSNVFSGYNGAAIYIASPVNGRALECPNLSSTFNSATATIAWTAILNPFGTAFTRGIGSQGGAGIPPIIGNAITLNASAGSTTTSYAIVGGQFGAAARYSIRMGGGTLVSPGASSDNSISPFRVNTAYINLTNSVAGEVGPNSAGLISNGGRFTNAYFQSETVAGGRSATTMTPDQIRIGGDTIATTNYATYPLQSFWYEGGLGDIFIFNRILSVEERQLLEGYLAHKYRCNNYLGSTSTTQTTNTFATYTITGGSVTGTGPWTHTLTFATSTQFVAGAQVTVSGVTNPTALNGTYTITNRSTTSVTFLASTTGSAWVAGGSVTSITNSSNSLQHPYRVTNPTITPAITPTSLYSIGLTAWFDAANPSSFLYSSGSLISQWNPIVTNIPGLALTQSTTGYYPSYVENAQNGLGGVRFTYVTSPSTIGNLLSSSGYASSNFVTQGQSPEITVFLVTKRLQSNLATIANIVEGGNSRHLLGVSGGFTVFSGVGGSEFRADANMTSVPAIGVPYVYTYTRKGTRTSVRTNGASNGTATNTGPINFSGITMSVVLGAYGAPPSGGEAYGGDIYELIIFRYAMTDALINQIEGYLAWKWGVRQSLPTTHPYYKVRP